jgi:hypothetical protein
MIRNPFMPRRSGTTMKQSLSRRTVLRGAGLAIALPWLESLMPRGARAQISGGTGNGLPKRYLPVFFPNGSPEQWWTGTMAGEGDNWTLSPILEPLLALKDKVTVISGLQNWSCFTTEGEQIEPSHGRLPGAFLSSVSRDLVKEQLGSNAEDINGVTVDQVIAQKANLGTPIASMQLGLSTIESFCDGRPCSLSQSISWSDTLTPLYKKVDPIEVFNQIVTNAPTDPGGGGGAAPPPSAEELKRVALNQSVLDAVQESAERTNLRLGAADKAKMEEFLTSVRAVETRATRVGQSLGSTLTCSTIQQPTMNAAYGMANGTNGYDKGAHMDVMNDLIVMAFQCDVTRVISYMLEDERSEFEYSHVPRREFTDTTSTPGNGGGCGNYHGSQHASDTDNGYASIIHWQASKMAELATKLSLVEESPGVSVLDNMILMFASCMHGFNHDGNKLPVALIGGGNGMLKTNQHLMFIERQMRDLHFTVMNSYFGMNETDFGHSELGTPISIIDEILT